MPEWPNPNPIYDNQPLQQIHLSPTQYDSIVTAIVILCILCAIIIAYLLWDRITHWKASRLGDERKRDLEKGKRKREEASSPGTAVGTDAHRSPQFQEIHLSPEEAGSASQSLDGEANLKFPLPPTITCDACIPAIDLTMPPSGTTRSVTDGPSVVGLSIGDRLRSHLMVREITGNVPGSADALLNATLGVNFDRPHSRSSLYTIAEASGEASSRDSSEMFPPGRSPMSSSSETAPSSQ